MTLNRRQFVQVVGVAGLGASSILGGGEAAEPAGPVIVDTHQHLWDLSKFDLPWLKSAGPLNRSHLAKDYAEATAGLNVTKAVYMEVDVRGDQQRAEADSILEVCRAKNSVTCAAVISGPVEAEGFREYILRYRGSPYIKGVRRLLFREETRGGRCLAERFVQHVQLLGELGMSFDLCIAAAELSDGVKLVDRCPGTRFILDHCGNANVQAFRAAPTDAAARQAVEQWRRDVAALAARKHVVCKISGIVASAPKADWKAEDLAPVVEHCLAEFGPDRVMFGGDWPVCTRVASFRQWVEALRQIVRSRPADEQQRLFSQNAIRFYGLSS